MGKRLRSLASELWETDDIPGTPSSLGCHKDPKIYELQLENDQLKEEVRLLHAQLQELKILSTDRLEVQHHNVDFGGCREPWLQSLRHDVAHLPRLHVEILPELMETGNCNGKISFDIPKNPKASASQVTQHVEAAVSRLSCKHPAVFKIGITANPSSRWNHSKYGYALDRREKWDGLKVLAINSSSFSAALLESFLISKFKGKPGCRNENPGGESASPGEGPHFTYVVYRVLVPPPRVVSRAASYSGPATSGSN